MRKSLIVNRKLIFHGRPYQPRFATRVCHFLVPFSFTSLRPLRRKLKAVSLMGRHRSTTKSSASFGSSVRYVQRCMCGDMRSCTLSSARCSVLLRFHRRNQDRVVGTTRHLSTPPRHWPRVVPKHTSRHDVPWRVGRFEAGALRACPCLLCPGRANAIHARCRVSLGVVVIDGEIEKRRCHLSEELLGSPLVSEGLAYLANVPPANGVRWVMINRSENIEHATIVALGLLRQA